MMTQTSTQPRSTSTAASDRPLVYVNGRMLPKSQATVNVFDHGLLYGDGIFEGIRVYRGKIFKCRQHMDRLYGCAKQLFLEIPVTPDEMTEIMRRCIAANEIIDGYIRLVVTRGEGTLGLNPFTCPQAGIVCIADQISLFTREQYEAGMRVVLAHRPKTPIACLDPRVKSLNYLNNIMAKVEAIHLSQALGITEAKDKLIEVIMLNTEGRVTEGSGDNIFIIKGGKLLTPPSEVGILEGITRRFVKNELCPMLGYQCQEREFGIADLLGADEVFLTGTAAEIIAVREVLEHDGKGHITKSHKISDGEGPITHALRKKFRQIATGDAVPED
ncbi:MAG: aminotransferase class IV [Phycisphaerales bacterium]|nr:aminotransferase class IV [Phycisphaerales bacterium]